MDAFVTSRPVDLPCFERTASGPLRHRHLRRRSAMGVVTRAKKSRLEEEENDDDRISRLPDGVLGDIVSLLPTKDGARTPALSSRWRHIWRSAPLNFALDAFKFNLVGCAAVAAGEISRILAAHHGPCRRFRTRIRYLCPDDCTAATLLDGWLRSPSLDGLQELDFHCGSWFPCGRSPPPPPLAPVCRFSSTLRAASFGGCAFPDDGDLHLPVLRQLSLVQSTMSETSVQALLAGCPALESLLLFCIIGFSCLRIVSSSLRSVAVHPGTRDEKSQWLTVVPGGNRILQHLVLEDAPCLERLLLFSAGDGTTIDISVISAPKLGVLGALSDDFSRVFQGPRLTVVPRIKILALHNCHLRLDVVINFLKCFPCLEKLCIKTTTTFARHKNKWGDEYWNLVGTLDIRVKKVVLLNYQGDTSHVNFAKFFVLNARILESMVLELGYGIKLISTEWVEKQHEHLGTKNRASSGARVNFVPHDSRSWMHGNLIEEQAHDLSTVDPFVRFREWSC